MRIAIKCAGHPFELPVLVCLDKRWGEPGCRITRSTPWVEIGDAECDVKFSSSFIAYIDAVNVRQLVIVCGYNTTTFFANRVWDAYCRYVWVFEVQREITYDGFTARQLRLVWSCRRVNPASPCVVSLPQA